MFLIWQSFTPDVLPKWTCPQLESNQQPFEVFKQTLYCPQVEKLNVEAHAQYFLYKKGNKMPNVSVTNKTKRKLHRSS